MEFLYLFLIKKTYLQQNQQHNGILWRSGFLFWEFEYIKNRMISYIIRLVSISQEKIVDFIYTKQAIKVLKVFVTTFRRYFKKLTTFETIFVIQFNKITRVDLEQLVSKSALCCMKANYLMTVWNKVFVTKPPYSQM